MPVVATIARPTGETLRGKQKEKDVRMSNIIAAKGSFVCNHDALPLTAIVSRAQSISNSRSLSLSIQPLQTLFARV